VFDMNAGESSDVDFFTTLKDLVDLWLETPYAGEGHQRLLDKIT